MAKEPFWKRGLKFSEKNKIMESESKGYSNVSIPFHH
jgi:hypothetical protein